MPTKSMAITTGMIIPWGGTAPGDFRINQVLDYFSILKASHFAY